MGSQLEQSHKRPGVFLAWTSGAAIIAMALSISATHVFAYLTMVLFGIFWIYARLAKKENFLPDAHPLPAPFKAAGLLFAWILISTSFRILSSGDVWGALRAAVRAEWNDIPLFLFGLVIFRLSGHEQCRRIIRGAFLIFCAIVLLSGAAALFSEFRLAKIFTGHNKIVTAENRPQHPFITLGTFIIYRPIGFMNTRLTYAGLLVLILPFLAASAKSAVDGWRAGMTAGKKLPSPAAAAAWLGFLLCVSILAINGTRSAILGAAGAMIGLVLLSLTPGPLRRILLGTALIAAGITTIVVVVEPHALSRFIRHTDFQRPIIWAGTADMIRDRPAIGTGAGGFTRETLAWRESYVRENPDDWYFVECTPRGHAHNDLLHIGAVAGLPGAFLFLVLLALTGAAATAFHFRSSEIFLPSMRGHEPGALILGVCGLFIAGTAQCYFQDDEVVIVLWTILAYAMAQAGKSNRPYTSLPDSSR